MLIQSHGSPPESTGTPSAEIAPLDPQQKASGPEFTDRERAALTFTAYDLDARLTPASSRLAMRARLTVRNDGSEPLARIALQISSTLTWESATLLQSPAGASDIRLPLQRLPLELSQHLLDTDADHTGKASEVLLTLPQPLAAGASVTLDTFYSGTLAASTNRLARLGAGPAQAEEADWDAVSSSGIALRGFGNVLWYPVAAPQLFLADGAALFHAVGEAKRRTAAASVMLHVLLEYSGEPPAAIYFCGRRQPLSALANNDDAPVANSTGIATASFTKQPLGFRTLSLFVADRPEALSAPLAAATDVPAQASSSSSQTSSSSSTASTATPIASGRPASGGTPLLATVTQDEGSLPRLAAAAQNIAPLLQQWFGARPLSALTVIDHPGQPFQDGPLVVAPIAALGASDASSALAYSLTHAWIQTGQPWIDEGLSQLASLLWVEHESGREAANAQLAGSMRPVTLADPEMNAAQLAAGGEGGQPLISPTDELYFRRKAGAVWWMLRGIAGDDPLRLALNALHAQPPSSASPREQAEAFQKLLERTSGKDLGWFFNDWVYRDLGLPDLSIIDVTPRPLPAGPGHDSGWLVAVTVRNDGAATAEIPVIIRSGSFSTTKALRVPGLGNATARMLVEAAPTEVVVNDGATPEVRTSLHTRTVNVRTQ